VSRISQQQLESYLWGAATLLRGTIDAGDYKQFIFPLLFYKRVCDVFDEETQAALKESGGDTDFAAYAENHRFQVPADAHWGKARGASKNVGRALQAAMRAVESANPAKLYGIFGDAQWTNKDRLSDAMLRDLVEHFSTLELTLANLPEDELGQGYEYLIKKFADDAGHTAAEFYTNRTVVHLMTEILQPQPGESIYDPTCGSGGMLLSCITHLRRLGKEWRNVRLYGQERNLMTSSIARMNCFLHGIEDFRIERGDTLSDPKFVDGDRLMRFDVALANPPYSIKQWDREGFASDSWGRNVYGTPPQGRADYAFWQHILCSLAPKTGRCAILFPHGVLFRKEEAGMRRNLIEADLIECVLGLGPNLFYNSPMEACVVICRTSKPKGRKGRVLFINAVNKVTRERAQSFLTDDHIKNIVAAYQRFEDVPGFARVVTANELGQQGGSLNITLYVAGTTPVPGIEAASNRRLVAESLSVWLSSASEVRYALDSLLGQKQRLTTLPAASTIAQGLPDWMKRSEWKRLPFGAFADSVNERVEPADAAEDIYVGLDDLDSGVLHIRRWGKGSDVIGTKLRFRRGDIVFGRRRAYQRKLAVAEMDGICSAHAMVVRAKSKVVLPEFLPFLMMSDQFMNRAVEISVGSLSPTINWTTLKLQEFDIPPLDQQRRISDTLWAVEHAAEANQRALENLQTLRASALESFVEENTTVVAGSRAPKRATWEASTVGELCEIRSGKVNSRAAVDDGKYPFFTCSPETLRSDRYSFDCEALLLAGNNAQGIYTVKHYKGKFQVRQRVYVITVRDLSVVGFKYLHLMMQRSLGRLRNLSVGSTSKHITLGDLQGLEVPVPPVDAQESLVTQVSRIDNAITLSRDNVSRLRGVQRQIFSQAQLTPRDEKSALHVQ
jgi:type I restriction enzyme M protein